MPPEFNSNQATSNMPVLGGSVARSIARFSRSAAKVSLPGLAELEDVATALIKNWKTADRNDSEFSGLATRVEGICSLLHEVDVMEHTGVSEALRRLYEIKGILAEELKRRSRLGVLGTEQKQRLLDSLRSEVDRIVEVTHLRLTIMQAQYHRHNPIDNFQVISAHDIIDRSVVYERNYYLASEDTNQPAISECWDPSCSVSVRGWRGRLGKTSVIYRTYRPHSDSSDATKAIETELKCLSRCLHPNVASVMGITKGYDGVSGYVLATDGMPLNQFMRHVDSGASLVKCIQGYEHAIVAVREVSQRFSVIHSDVTVQPNGHLVASPALYNSGYYPLGPSYGKTSHPATLLVLGIHNINNNTRPPHPELANFLDDISVLGRQTFTVLEVARLAAKYKALPGRRMHSWDDEASAPPFTINAEDTGYTSQQFPRSFWTPGKPRQVGLDGDDVIVNYFSHCAFDNFQDYNQRRVESGQWMSVSLHVCECVREYFGWSESSCVENSYEWARRERASLRDCGMEVEGAQFCTSVCFQIFYSRIKPIKPPELLYFHRNPSMHIDPRAFWGFLSTSADPCSPGVDPAEVGLELTYRVHYDTIPLMDFWDYKYEKMLQLGLASIPGGYPGSYLEEVLKDEMD